MQLRDLVSIQECEILNMRKSMKFCRIQELMLEIQRLRTGGNSDDGEKEYLRIEVTRLQEHLTKMMSTERTTTTL